MPDWGKIALYGGAAVGTYFIARAIMNQKGGTAPAGSIGTGGGGGAVGPGWDGLVPNGKGIFIYDLDDAKPAGSGTPQTMADKLEWLDMDWVMIQTHRIENGQLKHTDTKAKRDSYIAAIREKGISVGFWGWPEPDMSEEFTEVALDMIAEHNPVGYMVNAEKPWRFATNSGIKATNMMQAIKDALGNRGLGFTSFGGGPPFIPGFPWDEFAEYADFGCPQIYDMDNKYSENYPSKAMAHWGELFDNNIPAWTCGGSKTPTTMISIQNRTPLSHLGACWWSYKAALYNNARAQVVRDYQLSFGTVA